MPLEAGSVNADSGISLYIYQAIEENLSPAFPDGPSEELKDGWKKFAFALADGLVKYIEAESSITDISVNNEDAKQLEILYSADDGKTYKAELPGTAEPDEGLPGG